MSASWASSSQQALRNVLQALSLTRNKAPPWSARFCKLRPPCPHHASEGVRKGKLFSRVRLFAAPWSIQSMEFSRPESWSGQPFPSPGYLPNPGIEASLSLCRWILYQLSHKGSPRVLEWVKVKSLSRVRLFASPWTVAYQAPWSMGFSRQEYWSGMPFPSPA